MRRTRSVLLLALIGLLVLGAGAAHAQEDEEGESIRGTIVQRPEEGEPVPVPGVEISVTMNGTEVEGSPVVTGEDGSYFLELPGPGDYAATLNQDTLPEGVQLTNPDRATLEFSLRPNQSRPLLFPLGEARERGSQFVARAVQLFAEGIKFGLIIAITSVGLSLIFGTTGLVNFAHGELVTFGAIIAWTINVLLGVPLVPAGIIAMAVGGLSGYLLDRGLWSPLRKRGTGLIAMLVISIGLSLLLRSAFNFQFGGRTRPFAQYAVQRAVDVGPFQLAPKDIFSILLSVAVLVGVALVLQRTRIGKAMRAVADNNDLAESSGIDVERVIGFVWFFGAALATLGGILLGLAEQVSFQMGFQLLLLMFAGVTLGGLGTAYGALLGSLVVGLFVQLSTLVVSPELKNVGALLILILILLVRPQGILGSAQRVG
ncbi:MAG: branched-chain amino acid ABC transporter permease [Actinomycetota bacterium]|nr:branched-chain amino acid ABC transporter permease [Actinomycetota bacterium]